VTVAVVDLFEVVEIDEDQDESAVAHRGVEPLGKQQPVRQPGEWVVVDLMRESALCLEQLPVQQPLRPQGDHLSRSDEQDHHHCGADQERTQLVTDENVEGEKACDPKEPGIGQDELRPVHVVLAAGGRRSRPAFQHRGQDHQWPERESDTAPQVAIFGPDGLQIRDHPVRGGDDHDAERQQEKVRPIGPIRAVDHRHERT